MDTSNVLQPITTMKRPIIVKVIRLLSAWLLSEVVMISTVLDFLDRLNQKGILGMGADFSPNQLIWGDGVLMNLFRLVIFIIFAGFFGFIYGYLSKKRVSVSEKIIVNVINSFLSIFGVLIIAVLVAVIFRPETIGEINPAMSIILDTIISSRFYLVFIFLNLLGCFIFGYYCVALGSGVISNPNYKFDKEKSGTLLGIKWYHYLWLWLPIGYYGQIALNLIYATGYTIVTFFMNVHWFEFLGFTVLSENNSGRSSIDIAWGNLIAIYIAAVIIFYLLVYLREILAGERQIHWALKILISIGIGVVIPVLLLLFTVLGG